MSAPKPAGVTAEEQQILNELYRSSKALSVDELAGKIGLHADHITIALRSLIEKGLVRK